MYIILPKYKGKWVIKGKKKINKY